MTDEQLKEVTLMVRLVKLLLVGGVAAGGWQTYVNLTLNQHTAQIAEVKASEAAERVALDDRTREYRSWREDVTKILTRQTALIEGQQAQMERLERLGDHH